MNKDLIIEYLKLEAELSAYKNDPESKEAEGVTYALENCYDTLCTIASFTESRWNDEALQNKVNTLTEELKEYKEEI